ncbi:MAG: disulfide oxidoreductase [Alphaproteobacteria bacterium]|nr:disulfide oxidoreductase [Alphaproteobacteria bacterium]
MATVPHNSRVVAVLGPTNTGKTYLAMERMLGHRSGMIGFPLRLLARENYDRIVRIKGAAAVALVTGEEKIIPPHPAYFVCTVESMPLDRQVAFLAVDEVQLCADPDRGHVFTDRLLHARGLEETVLLGADTMKPLIRRLVTEAEFVSRPRFSRLLYTPPRKLTRLPPRSAVVAFSAADVYAIAEMVRRQRGGAAVVLGALSPRTRNAQVALYQSGEVDYMVATDAIGMGLNMDVDHVCFAAVRKFDGRAPRDLTATEVAQIAGRAGRHMNDGTFGTSTDTGEFDQEIIARVENHDFTPLKGIFWRNSNLRYTSVEALLASLNAPPTVPGLVRARPANDQQVLEVLAADEDLRKLVTAPERVRLLWEVCRIPDFRKVMAASHARLLGQIFRYLAGPEERLPPDWIAGQVRRLDRIEGDIDALVERIAHVRTWTYVSHHSQWLEDPTAWQERTRAVEDRLSDALHQRLTQRFVDRRTAVLMRGLKNKGELRAAVSTDGEVKVEGHFVGRLSGLCFLADDSEDANARRTVLAAAARSLPHEIGRRVRDIENEPDDAFALLGDGTLTWRGAPVARLTAGSEALRPAVSPLASDLVNEALRERVRRRLDDWITAHIASMLAPLVKARASPARGAVRGLVFQLTEAMGTLPRRAVETQLAALDDADRKTLARLAIRMGVESLYVPELLKPSRQHLAGLLWRLYHDEAAAAVPVPTRVCLPIDTNLSEGTYAALGYRILGGLAVRADMLERFAAAVRHHRRSHEAAPLPGEVLSLLGLGPENGIRLLTALGYAVVTTPDGLTVGQRKGEPRHRPQVKADDNSPFAKLRQLSGR